MWFQRVGSQVAVLAPAKINLFLELLGKRADGFHELETAMVAVSLFDRLEFTPTEGRGVTLDCAWEPGQWAAAARLGEPGDFLGDLPPQESNLVVRAVKLLQAEENVPHGARIVLRKRIPSASGFGGASSDAAAALWAAHLGWKLNLPIARLQELAGRLGSDIPFFLHAGQLGSGQAVATGRGERIHPYDGPRLHLVLIRPAGGLSTAEVYRACQVPDSPQSASQLLAALRNGRRMAIRESLVNRLTPPAMALSSQINRLASTCEKLDVVAHQMSGSGSGYFALCRSHRHARQVAARLKARGVGMVFPVTTCGIRSLRN